MNSVLNCNFSSTVPHTGQPCSSGAKKGGHRDRHVRSLMDAKVVAEGDKESRKQEPILHPALVEQPRD